MPCIIGMTTDLSRRKAEWEREYRFLRNWRVFQSGLSRAQAQALETQLAAQYGCDSHHAGNAPDIPSSWGGLWVRAQRMVKESTN